MKEEESITVSAPGKALLAGGYLVLESPNAGLVMAVDKRFYTTVQVLSRSSSSSSLSIRVDSPQFQQSWQYIWDRTRQNLTPDAITHGNPFVEKTLRVSLLYLLQNDESSSPIDAIQLTIKADNDFYSLVPHLKEREWPVSLESALQLPACLPAARDEEGKIYKTGLGSSACLVTSMVGALCQLWGTKSSNPQQQRYNLAQICHCHAQGKVGSGFDVSAAVHGSHVYQRFPKEGLTDLLKALEDNNNDDVDATAALLAQSTNATWPGGVVAPLGDGLLQVTLADVSGGSESPSMARTVLAWKKEQSSPVPHWDDLKALNQQIIDTWLQVTELSVSAAEMTQLAVSPTAWKQLAGTNDKNETTSTVSRAASLLDQLHQLFQQSRHHLRAMGEAAGVPIEPPAQTALADATMEIPGVVAALVPGAGGYDAMACLYVDVPSVRQRIGQVWAAWPAAQVCPLTVQAAPFGRGVVTETTTT